VDQLLASFTDGQVEISSVGCTHFNQSLAAVVEGRPHKNEKLCIDGKLSMAKVVQRYPVLKSVFEHGLTWWIWKAEVDDLYPDLADIAQRALNAKYSVQQGQDGFHLFARAVNILSTVKTENVVAYAVKDILKSNPKSPAEIPSLVEVARKFGGGDNTFVEPLLRFNAAFKVAGREVSASTWKSLAELKFAAADLSPQVIISVVMALAAAPSANFITANDVKTLMKKKRTHGRWCCAKASSQMLKTPAMRSVKVLPTIPSTLESCGATSCTNSSTKSKRYRRKRMSRSPVSSSIRSKSLGAPLKLVKKGC
jgi:hypothetical protein